MIKRIIPFVAFAMIITSCSTDYDADATLQENSNIQLETRSDDCFDEAYEKAGDAIADCKEAGGSNADCIREGDEAFYDHMANCE